ncbi:Ribonuclease/ribotoxin [Plectosphaerella plurivora]|uniref:ribonuclease T1 n=1 Tax=Plectosphaerella plurivora TaxID=936078 RepID=A0A9P9AFV2_9PEZI|nr:Ribonuclease/ribotoxin [Plectosphaerella plurivora]
MRFFTAILPLVALLSGVSALPIADDVSPVEASPLERRAAATCGSQFYSAAAVNAAAVRACNLYRAGTQIGSNNYPHTFNNREGFAFAAAGPYQEFPIMASGAIYSGGSPGPDRVVINTSCRQAGAITHTGASGNNFVICR